MDMYQRYGRNPFQMADRNLDFATSITTNAGRDSGFEAAAGEAATRLAAPGFMQQSMNSFLNPYVDDVVDLSLARFDKNRDIQMNNISGEADAAGAFGGSRHALREALASDDFGVQRNELLANLMLQGYDRAGALAGQEAGIMGQGAGLLAGLSGQETNRELATGNQLAQLAEMNFNAGRTINADQMQSGTTQQLLLQGLIDTAGQNFDAYTERPNEVLDAILAALSGNPLNRESTQTTQSTPGLFDYLSLATQLGGSYLSGR